MYEKQISSAQVAWKNLTKERFCADSYIDGKERSVAGFVKDLNLSNGVCWDKKFVVH